MAAFPVSLLADQSMSAFIISPWEQNVHTVASDLQRLQEAEADQENVLECSLPCLCWDFLQWQGILGETTSPDHDMDWLAVHSLEELGYTNGHGKEIPRYLGESRVPFLAGQTAVSIYDYILLFEHWNRRNSAFPCLL